MEKEKKPAELSDEQLGKVSGGYMEFKATPFEYVTLQDGASQPVVCPACGNAHFTMGSVSYLQNGEKIEQHWTYTCTQCGAETQPLSTSVYRVTFH